MRPNFIITVVNRKGHLLYYVNGEFEQSSDSGEYNTTIKEIVNDLIDRFGDVNIEIKTR